MTHEYGYHRPHAWQGQVQNSTPRLDIYRTESSYRFVFELPGVDENQVDIFYEPGTLTVEGVLPDTQDMGQPVSVERPTGRFTRQVSIPETVDVEQINASFDRGLLLVEVAEEGSRHRRRIRLGRRSDEPVQEIND